MASDLKGPELSLGLPEDTMASASVSNRLFNAASIDEAPPPSYAAACGPAVELESQLPDCPVTSFFDPEDYAADDCIPDYLLDPDTWLPDPPEQPARRRDADIPTDLPNGNAVLTYADSLGSLCRIENLHLDIIEQRSPLIAAAFEASNRQHCLHLDALTPISARPFVRYIYLGSYAEVEAQYEDVPSSLLLHCQLHFLGALFDMHELQDQALVNVIRQCEFACFSPDQPIDLCVAIRFCHEHIDYCRRPLENIVAYCIERFSAHRLGEDSVFLELAYSHKRFHNDLARALVDRNYKDESAFDIIRLPFAPHSVGEGILAACETSLRQAEQAEREHDEDAKTPAEDGATAIIQAKCTVSTQPPLVQQSLLTLAFRSKQSEAIDHLAVSEESRAHKRQRSDDGDFVLVDRTSCTQHRDGPDSCADAEPFVLLSADEPYTSSAVQSPARAGAMNIGEDKAVMFEVAAQDSAQSMNAMRSTAGHSCSSSPTSDSSWVLT